MTTFDIQHVQKAPLWFWLIAAFGVIWNIYGAYQFIGSFSQTEASLMAAGMTAAQAGLYLALPAWLGIAFAIGVFGGLAGSVLLLLRKGIALPVLAVSLAGYIVLFAGDAYFGVFANIPSQLLILAVVVAVAAILLWSAWFARSRHLLS